MDDQTHRKLSEQGNDDSERAYIAIEHIFQFFSWRHLPPDLQSVSKPFQMLAMQIIDQLPRNPERTVALRKLLEAKDAAVRARLAL